MSLRANSSLSLLPSDSKPMISLPFTGGNRLLRRIHAFESSSRHGRTAFVRRVVASERDKLCCTNTHNDRGKPLGASLSVAFTRSHRRRGLPVKIGVHSSGKRLALYAPNDRKRVFVRAGARPTDRKTDDKRYLPNEPRYLSSSDFERAI